MKKSILGISIGIVLGSVSFISNAEITLLQQNPQPNDPLSRLTFQVGGSIRPQMNAVTGQKSFKDNGFDGGSRFRFSSDYYLFDDISWINYYELGVNFPALLDMDNHHADGANNTIRRQLYTGFKSKTLGQLTFGQQLSVYYDVVGGKTDVWDDDMLAQAPGNGINGDYDGSYRSRKQLKYKVKAGNADLYAAYLFADDDYLTPDNFHYRRNGGGALGINYHLTPTLSWGLAYDYTNADLKEPTAGKSKEYNQSIMGTGLSWTPGNWMVSASGGFYQNFLTTKIKDTNDYFAGDAYGIEYFAGYTFPINSFAIKTIKPYFMGDRLEYLDDRNYEKLDNGVGISFQLKYGFRVDYEHVFTTATGGNYGTNIIRAWYDF
ncbi:autotransporter domain-containing protein [Sodalis sp. dw_96]|uniref:porin n=1 Tax=Sodalis sp. dw_96 TaxID=2719794 RepID=UPI001BD66DB3|nr:autotransporter domain-containing protein [Sodalis sp. dw_96]